jgi:hypothetical protein
MDVHCLSCKNNSSSSREVRTSRDHDNTWDPRKANDSNSVGHSRVISNSIVISTPEATGTLWEATYQGRYSNSRDVSNISDVSNNRDTSKSSVAS